MDNVLLDGGLDLVHARPAILPGRIRDCLNYDVGWERGYSRIDGWERFDGHTNPSATDYWIVVMPTTDVTGVVEDVVTELVWTTPDADGEAGVMVDYVNSPTVGGGVSSFAIVFRSGRVRPPWDAVISDEAGTWSFVLDQSTTSVYKLSEVHGTHKGFLDTLSLYAEKLRDEVRPVPGGGTIVGLHYHEDQLYAIRDTAYVTVGEENLGLIEVGQYVCTSAGPDNMGEVVSVDEDTGKVAIASVDADGFTMPPEGGVLYLMLTIRFSEGSGEWNKWDAVTTVAGQGTFAYLDRRDGSFESASAVGYAVFWDTPGAPTDGSPVTNNNTGGSMISDYGVYAETQPLLTVLSASSQSTAAAFWRSTDDGWESADSQRTLAFTQGTNNPAEGTVVNSSTVKLPTIVEWVSAGATGAGDPAWQPDNQSGWDRIKVADVNAISSTIGSYNSLFGRVSGSTDRLRVRGFNFGILDSEEILGIEFTINGRQGTAGQTAYAKAQLSNQTENTSRTIAVPTVGAYEERSNSSPDTDLWAKTWTPAEINSANFGFIVAGYSSANVSAVPYIEHVKVTIHKKGEVGSQLFLWDPVTATDLGTIRVSSTKVVSGEWGGVEPDPGLAEGYFILSDWSGVSLPAGAEIWTAAGGTDIFIAIAQGNVSLPLLPGSLLLDENKSKYQMISYNFFATEEQNAIYGVSGAGLAFWYDGTALDFIPTGVPLDTDKPRHIAPHENRLALGYIWGEVYVSGTDPTDFGTTSGSQGTALAASFGFGDKITGLMPISGKALAVFTESSVWALQGAPTSFGETGLDGVEQTVINHKVGAIEYTVQNIGNRPIFASFRGIETLDTMDQYSDFFTAPLTYDVSPWLLRRLQTAAGVETTDESVVNSVVVRNKNQYRLFFADGYVLTLTYVGPEKEPQCTIQQYWFNSDRDQYARVYATASGVSTRGQDHSFFSAEQRPSRPRAQAVETPYIDYVYELDRGRSFDGGVIESYFDLTQYYSKDPQSGGPAPYATKRDNIIHVHGKVAGYASLRMSRAVNYESMDDPSLPYEPVPFGSLLHKPEDQAQDKFTKGRVTARGFALSIRFMHESAIEFPHTLQMLTYLDDTQTRPNR